MSKQIDALGMEGLLFIFGFYLLLALIGWTSERIQSIRRERHLLRQLQTLEEQVAQIDINLANQELKNLQSQAKELFDRIGKQRLKQLFHKPERDEGVAIERHERSLKSMFDQMNKSFRRK